MSQALNLHLQKTGAWIKSLAPFSCALLLSQGSLGHSQLTERWKFVASDARPDDFLGEAVAISGDTAVIGAAYADLGVKADAGAAYVLVRNGATWTEQAKLTPSDPLKADHFGISVAISGDTVLIGADQWNSYGRNGKAYVFVRSGTSWTQQAKLTASDGSFPDAFGRSVAISGDTVVVGAWQHTHAPYFACGASYVFIRTGSSWSQQAELVPDLVGDDAYCGYGVAIEGETIVVGAPTHSLPGVLHAGSAFVFARSGTIWTQQAELDASDPGKDDYFGRVVSISGETVVVGSPLDDNSGGAGAGSVYVFVKNGTTWAQQAKLRASDPYAGAELGIGVFLEGDTCLAGADITPDGGSAYLFVRNGASWTQRAKLTASDLEVSDFFGHGVALSGQTCVVGSLYDDHAGGIDAGSACFYDLSPGTALPHAGDGVNVDVLSAGAVTLGRTWTASLAIGHPHGTGGPLILKMQANTINGPSFPSPLGGRACEFLIGGPFLASITGTHDGASGTFPAQAIPWSLAGISWAAQATVLGGGFGDLSTAVYGTVGL